MHIYTYLNVELRPSAHYSSGKDHVGYKVPNKGTENDVAIVVWDGERHNDPFSRIY